MSAVRTGYKETEIGLLPVDWEVKALGECAAFRTGPFGSALHKSDYTLDGVPVVNPMHIVDGNIMPSRAMTITEAAASALSDFRLRPGEVVIGRRGDMGRCAVVREPQRGWLCGTGSMIIRPFSVDPEFLQRVVSSPRAVAAIVDASVGTTMVNINQETLRGLPIQSPSLSEQRRISEALRDVDALLAGLDRLIAKKRDLKQAAMQQLLTGQTRLPGFNRPWQRKPLGEVLAICHGKSQGDVEVLDGSYPILATGGRIGTASKALYDKPSVLIGRKGTINQPQYMDTPFWTVDTLFYSAMKARHCAKFFYYRFCLIDWMQFNEASGVPSLSARTIEMIEVDCPEPEEQMLIAATLSDMDDEIAAIERRLTKARTVKQAMMQELLTGRIRLI